jgi:hypothetical protein
VKDEEAASMAPGAMEGGEGGALDEEPPGMA